MLASGGRLRAAEDRNIWTMAVTGMRPAVAVAFRAAEDRNYFPVIDEDDDGGCGGRLPRRPRIATTPSRWPRRQPSAWRSPSRATEDRNDTKTVGRVGFDVEWRSPLEMAVAFRGDPRIKQPALRRSRPSPGQWRSPSSATEDRNVQDCLTRVAAIEVAVASGATEDRNAIQTISAKEGACGSHPQGTEDRNYIETPRCYNTVDGDGRLAG